MASASELDAALLDPKDPQWTKVAMVLGRAENAGYHVPRRKGLFEVLANRLSELVASGQVLSRDDHAN